MITLGLPHLSGALLTLFITAGVDSHPGHDY